MLTGPPPKFHGTAVVVPTALEVRKWGRWRTFKSGEPAPRPSRTAT